MFFGPVALTQAVLPHMRERGSGAIVQMSSMGGQLASPASAPTARRSSRSRPLSESLAAEVEPHGHPRADRRARLVPHRVRRRADAPVARARRLRRHRRRDARVHRRAWTATQPGDPAKAAAAILAALDAPDARCGSRSATTRSTRSAASSSAAAPTSTGASHVSRAAVFDEPATGQPATAHVSPQRGEAGGQQPAGACPRRREHVAPAGRVEREPGGQRRPEQGPAVLAARAQRSGHPDPYGRSSTSPPSRTAAGDVARRTSARSPVQSIDAPSASAQIPSGPTPSAPARRFDAQAAVVRRMSNAVSRAVRSRLPR